MALVNPTMTPSGVEQADAGWLAESLAE